MAQFLNKIPKETPGQAQLRRHYFLDKYVVIAPKRSHSLHHQKFRKGGELRNPPLENEPAVLEIADPHDGQWAVKVIRNLYPAFSPGNKLAQGVQEIVLEAHPSDVPMSRMPVEQFERIFSAYCQRIMALRKIKDVKYVSVFHNRGLEAGASVRQTHSQIIAISDPPPDIRDYAQVFEQLKLRYGTSPLRKAMTWEQQRLARVFFNNKQLIAVAPYASEYPYEAWLVPWRQVKSICDLKPKERTALAKTLQAVVRTLENEGISYNYYLQEDLRGRENHFMIRVCPRPNVWAGFELSTGIPINPVSPEEAARWYRKFIREHSAL